MSIFSANALVLGTKTKPPNPLKTIGFSQAIFGLKLTEDQLWEYAKKTARRLVVLLHPDPGVEELETSELIRNASDLLKDRPTFLEALAELRREHSERRTGENLRKRSQDAQQRVAQQTEELLREQIAVNGRLTETNKRLSAMIASVASDRIVTIKNKSGEASGRRVMMPSQAHRALVMHIDIRHSAKKRGDDELLRKILEEHRRDLAQVDPQGEHRAKEEKRIQTETVQKLAKAGFTTTGLERLIDQALRKPIPIIQWGLGEALEELGNPFGPQAKRKALPATEIIASSADPKACTTRYRTAFEFVMMGLLRYAPRLTQANVYPEIIDLAGGWHAGRLVLGSVFPEELWEDEDAEVTSTRGPLTIGLYPEDLRYPLVSEGGLLVTASPVTVGLRGSSARERARAYRKGREYRTSMTSSHFVIELID